MNSVRRELCCRGNPNNDYDPDNDDDYDYDPDDDYDHDDSFIFCHVVQRWVPQYMLTAEGPIGPIYIYVPRDPLDQYSDWPCNKCDFSLEVPDLFTCFAFSTFEEVL